MVPCLLNQGYIITTSYWHLVVVLKVFTHIMLFFLHLRICIRRPYRLGYYFSQIAVLFMLLSGSQFSIAQSAYSFCLPELISYTRQAYDAYNQNWSIAQNPGSRFVYFANSKGLLEFDGNRWQLYQLPKKQRVRSVSIDKEGRIYTGGLGEFGYWFPGKRGELIYHSLVADIREKTFQNEEIWNILITPTGVLFQSFAFMYRYQAGKSHRLVTPGNILFLHWVHNRQLLGVIDKGLYELQDNNQFVLLKGSEFLGRETVNTILPMDNQDILIGTERAIYRYDGQQFHPFNTQINAFMQQNRLNRGIRLGPDLYAFGTILNGVLITTMDGQVRYHFNKKNGLQNNTVLALCQDNDQNLWIGLDKGIDLVNLDSPVRYFIDHEGSLGTVYDIAQFANKLYLGTNQGIYWRPLNQPDKSFQLISGTQGQVWNLSVVDNQLLCGHNKGTFRIDGTQAQLISGVTGGWVFGRLKGHPDELIQGTYTNLCIYQKDNQGKWVFSHTVSGFSAPVRQLEESADGTIWVNKAANQGLQRLRLSPDLRRVEVSNEYPDSQVSGPVLNLCRVANRIVITTPQGLRVYDATQDKFVAADPVYPWADNNIRKVFSMPDSSLFLLRQDGTVAWAQLHKTAPVYVPINANHWVDAFEEVVSLDSAHIAFCRENGFALLSRSELNQQTAVVPSPVIRLIMPTDNPDERRVFWRGESPEQLTFAYNQSNLLINFSTPYYTQPVRYSYWLENGTKTWSAFAAIQQKEFSNLPPGQYVFHLKSDLSFTESSLAFEIRPPWYWNGWSKLVYLLLFGYLCWLFYRLHLRRLVEQKQQIQEKLEEKLRHQEEQSQREIILLQKQQLEQGLIQKSEELANSTMSLIQKNELLMQLKEELNRVKGRSGGREGEDFGRINTLIDNNISSEQDWKLFEANFNKVHEEFLKHLIANYPDLGQGDLKLAAYLRMNLSTKEIAQLLNITHRSVELKRYRLRKKLNLGADTNLGEFMIKY